MIQLLFLVLFAECVLAFLLLVKIGPLRELVIKSLDQLKIGKGPATVKTIAGTMFVILLSSLMSIVKIQNKGAKLGTMSPMDQVLWRTHLLEASLMAFRGFCRREEDMKKRGCGSFNVVSGLQCFWKVVTQVLVPLGTFPEPL
ncbi:uncharacterized protein LOC142643944 [Castanea sativa]|uniref:uncharacterized protein LOC142643944 n=1 Tax=Castanea sativa TaxID=21020 RepID=UPI003F649BDF